MKYYTDKSMHNNLLLNIYIYKYSIWVPKKLDGNRNLCVSTPAVFGWATDIDLTYVRAGGGRAVMGGGLGNLIAGAISFLIIFSLIPE